MNIPTSETDRVQPDKANDGDQQREAEASRGKSMKFVYPTGSRPLEGYTIKRGVGRGGFGEVYFATSDAGKEVALKLIRRNLDVELRGVKHCLNLKHNNLIGLYDIRTDKQDDQWVVMEYVSGKSLEDAIDAHPKGMPVELVLGWIKGVAAGVAYLHDHGIVHRDLKPGNIFLDYDSGSVGPGGLHGTVKIGDYGLSKFISCSRRSGQTESVGTVHYMAPEIANGRYGREIDTYALGIILYEMLTGDVPFEGESMGEVLMKHLTAEPDLARVPPAFRELIKRTLAKDPEVRLGNVHEFVSLLPGEQPPAAAAPAAPTPRPQEVEPAGMRVEYSGYDDASMSHRAMLTPEQKVIREPIFAALGDFFGTLKRSLSNSGMPPAMQGLLIIGGVIVAAMLAPMFAPLFVVLVPLGIGLTILYSIYYVFWSLLVRPAIRAHKRRVVARRWRYDPEGPEPDRFHSASTKKGHPAGDKKRHRHWRQIVQSELAEKSVRERITQLLGSMFLSGVLCTLLSVLGTMLVTDNAAAIGPMQVWMSIVSTLGCWGVLFVHHLTEARTEDQAPSRSLLLAVGAAVGAIAFGLSSAMSLEMPVFHDFGPHPTDTLLGEVGNVQRPMMQGWRDRAVTPSPAVSVIYFALLFTLPRWQRSTDFTRSLRIGPWSVIGLMLWAWLLHLVWWYPQPVGILMAAVVGVSTQLASPWLPPSKRVEIAKNRSYV